MSKAKNLDLVNSSGVRWFRKHKSGHNWLELYKIEKLGKIKNCKIMDKIEKLDKIEKRT